MTQAAPRLRAVAPVARPIEPAMKKPIHRTTWKPHELAAVVARARDLLAISPAMPMHIAARRAQEEVLPPERWRVFRQYKDVQNWLPSALSIAPSPPRRYPRAIKPVIPPEPSPPVATVAPPAPTVEPPPVATIAPALLTVLADQLAPLLAARVDAHMVRVMEALTDALRAAQGQGHPAGAPGAPTAIPAPSRIRLPRVTVVGLIPQQERDVEAAFSGVIDFVFVKAQRTGGGGHGGAGMLTKSASSDLVLCMTDFVGHDVEHSAKHLRVPFERINGSVSALKRWLTDWLATGKAS